VPLAARNLGSLSRRFDILLQSRALVTERHPVLGRLRAERRLGAAGDCVSSVDLSAQIIYFCASQALHAKTRLSRPALILRVRPALRVYGRRTRRPCWSRAIVGLVHADRSSQADAAWAGVVSTAARLLVKKSASLVMAGPTYCSL
jgi:hypothetical protein